MVTEGQYRCALLAKEEADATIKQYYEENQEKLNQRLVNNPMFTDEELTYSAITLCPCGHGLAYPKGCNSDHYWDCSAILKGIADPNATHTDKLPFVFYDIRAESDHRGTSRGVFKPKVSIDKEKQ